MHLEYPYSKSVHCGCVLKVILTFIPDLCSGVFCEKRVVSSYVPLLELFYYCMIIVKNPQHTLKITKLQKFVRLIILLTTSCTIVRICMHLDNPTETNNTGKTSQQQPSFFQNKQSCFQWFDARLVRPLNTRWWAMNKKPMPFMQHPATARIFPQFYIGRIIIVWHLKWEFIVHVVTPPFPP